MFLYEPWRNICRSADIDHNTLSQPPLQSVPYGHCSDFGLSPTVVPVAKGNRPARRRHRDESFPGTINGDYSYGVVPDSNREEPFPDHLSDSRNETLVAGSISSNYSGSLHTECDSESEVSVVFHEQTHTFVKLPKIASMLQCRGHQLDSADTDREIDIEESIRKTQNKATDAEVDQLAQRRRGPKQNSKEAVLKSLAIIKPGQRSAQTDSLVEGGRGKYQLHSTSFQEKGESLTFHRSRDHLRRCTSVAACPISAVERDSNDSLEITAHVNVRQMETLSDSRGQAGGENKGEGCCPRTTGTDHLLQQPE